MTDPATMGSATMPPRKQSNTLASIDMISSSAAFTVLNTSVKVLATQYDLPTFEIVFLRCVAMLILTVAMILLQLYIGRREILDDNTNWTEMWVGPTSMRKALLLRGLFGFLGSSCSFWAVTLLPIPDAITILFINPIVTGFGSYFIFHESYTFVDGLGAMICMIGVVIITRPSSLFPAPAYLCTLFGWATPDDKSGSRLFGVLIALCGTFCISGAVLTLRYLGPRCKPHHNLLYFCVTCLTLPLLTISFVGQTWRLPVSKDGWTILIFASISGFAAEILLTFAMKKAVTIAPKSAGLPKKGTKRKVSSAFGEDDDGKFVEGKSREVNGSASLAIQSGKDLTHQKAKSSKILEYGTIINKRSKAETKDDVERSEKNDVEDNGDEDQSDEDEVDWAGERIDEDEPDDENSNSEEDEAAESDIDTEGFDSTITKRYSKDKKLYRLPTSDEMTQIKQTNDMFKSNVFRLQIDELLKEVRVDYTRTGPVEKVLHQLKKTMDSIPSIPEATVQEAVSMVESKFEMIIPFPYPPPSPDAMYKFQFEKPSNMFLIGSYLVKTTAKNPGGLNLDVAVQMPNLSSLAVSNKGCRISTLRSGFKAFHGDRRRPILVLTPSETDRAAHFTIRVLPMISPNLFPASRLSPSRNNVRPAMAASASAPSSVSLPPTPEYNSLILQDTCFVSHLNIIHSHAQSTPAFRDAIIFAKVWLAQRNFIGNPCSTQHRQSPEPVGRDGVVFGGYLIAMIMAYLFKAPTRVSTQQSAMKRLSASFSSYQMFKVTIEFLASHNFESDPIFMTEDGLPLTDQEFSKEAFQRYFEVVIVDLSGHIKLAAGMSRAMLDEIQHDARMTVQHLNDPTSDRFENIFLKKADIPYLRFDNVMSICPPTTPPPTYSQVACDNPSPHRYLQRVMPSLLKRGISSRCPLIAICSAPLPKWDCDIDPQTGRSVRKENVKSKKSKDSAQHVRQPITHEAMRTPISILLILDPQASLRVVEHGPLADDASAVVVENEAIEHGTSARDAVKEFRDLWGPKAELRRFKDGTVRESVVFECEADGDESTSAGGEKGQASVGQRSAIIGRMVAYLLERHVPGLSIDNGTLTMWTGQVLARTFLKEHDSRAAMEVVAAAVPPLFADKSKNSRGAEAAERVAKALKDAAGKVVHGGESFQSVMAAFDRFARSLKDLASNAKSELPLSIVNVAPCSAGLRYSSVFVPRNQETIARTNAKWVQKKSRDFTDSTGEKEEESYYPIRLRDIMDVNVEFESSTFWPDDLAAVERIKTAFYIQLAEKFAQKEGGIKSGVRVQVARGGSARIEGGKKSGTPQQGDDWDSGYLDVTTSEGYTFRCRIHHEREQLLHEKAIVDLQTLLKRQASQVQMLQKPQESGKADNNSRGWHQPVARRSYAVGTFRLKSSRASESFGFWKSVTPPVFVSTCGGGVGIPEEVAELIAVKVFVQATSEFGWSSPASSGECGFLRCLAVLRSWEWEGRPFIVELDRAAKEAGGEGADDPEVQQRLKDKSSSWTESVPVEAEISKSFAHARQLANHASSLEGAPSPRYSTTHFMYVATDLDPAGIWWSFSSLRVQPNAAMTIKRLKVLSSSALKCIELSASPYSQLISPTEMQLMAVPGTVVSNLAKIFITPVQGYDVLIRLRAGLCPRYSQSVAFDPRSLPGTVLIAATRSATPFKNLTSASALTPSFADENDSRVYEEARMVAILCREASAARTGWALEYMDPVERYVEDLKRAFGDVADGSAVGEGSAGIANRSGYPCIARVFADVFGGTTMGIVFERTTIFGGSGAVSWKANLAVSTAPVSGKGQAAQVKANLAGMVAEMRRLGGILVDRVDIAKEWSDVLSAVRTYEH
ncbi:Nrap protein-domain-containing protein [Cladochytrium replicatum]|nr:Nrap protein-domain-containing protein [Cladochytrium replicatum]